MEAAAIVQDSPLSTILAWKFDSVGRRFALSPRRGCRIAIQRRLGALFIETVEAGRGAQPNVKRFFGVQDVPFDRRSGSKTCPVSIIFAGDVEEAIGEASRDADMLVAAASQRMMCRLLALSRRKAALVQELPDDSSGGFGDGLARGL